jgi:hypothetical protein
VKRSLADSQYSSCAEVCVRLSVVSNTNLYLYRTVSGYQLTRRLEVSNGISPASAYLSITITYGTSILVYKNSES